MTKMLDTVKLMKKESKSLGWKERMILYKEMWFDFEKIKSIYDQMYLEFEVEIIKNILKGKSKKLKGLESQGVSYALNDYSGGENCLEFYFQHQGIYYTLLFGFDLCYEPSMDFFLAFNCNKMDEPTPQENQQILSFLKRVKKAVTPLVKKMYITEVTPHDPTQNLMGVIPMADDLDKTLFHIIDLVLEQRGSGE